MSRLPSSDFASKHRVYSPGVMLTSCSSSTSHWLAEAELMEKSAKPLKVTPAGAAVNLPWPLEKVPSDNKLPAVDTPLLLELLEEEDDELDELELEELELEELELELELELEELELLEVDVLPSGSFDPPHAARSAAHSIGPRVLIIL